MLAKILIKKDTLLNVFLAIAVDNLATAQEMTAEQEEAEEQELKYLISLKHTLIKNFKNRAEKNANLIQPEEFKILTRRVDSMETSIGQIVGRV